MFSLRHLPLCTLLLSCSIYDESLLDDAQPVGRGGATNDSSSGGATSKAGESPSLGGYANGDSGSGNESGRNEPGSGAGSGATAEGGSRSTAGTSTGGTSIVVGGGSAATGGSGGTQSPPTVVDMLDDMEDGNFYLLAKPPRYGYWYVAGDTTAGAKLPKIEDLVATFDPARDDSTSGVSYRATGFKGWGASVGLTFADSTQKRTPYDGGNAVGVSLWMRGTVANNTKLRVLFPIAGTDPSGKDCGGDGQGECLDHFATQVTVTDKWQQVTILFANLHQAGWGAPLGAFDPAHMLGIEWTSGVSDADVWIDDLALLRP